MSRGTLAGRGVIVTGAGRGIGTAVARALAVAGAKVVLAARTQQEIDRVAAELRSLGFQTCAVVCDVTQEESVRRLGEAARQEFGAIDMLVNNAGGVSSAPLAKITLQDWERTLAVNATGTFLCTRELVPDMVKRGWGRVVNIASVAGLRGAKYVAHYSAAKHAVIGFTRSVALELAGTGVTINAVCPGYVDTPMTEHTVANVQSRAGLSREQALAGVLATTGQERLIAPEEVAEAVLGLCRDETANGRAVVLGADA
ncbi:MAG TPA: SDR family NAD(P)-dependent oxidoreductase [Candidatus Limnocylindria bacterium]|nr:SDR family NAD(P)-dependent oxidoreductase [Candidatus Limnocylindria bacterium]